MAGASPSHQRIGGNLFREIANHLEGKTCEVFYELRVRVEPADYNYPDLSVACPAEFDGEILTNPSVLVEILSDSTENFDRGRKWEQYRQLPSPREYLLVSQYKPHIVQYVRQANGEWLLRDLNCLAATLRIASLEPTVPLTKIYDRVEFPPRPLPEPQS